MINEGILKNYPKFKVLKMADGINLENAKFTKRKKDINAPSTSLKKYGNYWFKLKKGNALFKTYDSDYNSELRELRIINELICQNLAKQIGVSYAEYEPAHIGKDNGLVTYNVLKDGQKLVPLAKFLRYDLSLKNNLVDISSAVTHYRDLGYNINSDVLYNLYTYIVFDALTLQTDRNNYNIYFILDKNTNTYTVSPLFDSEYAFNGEYLELSYTNKINTYDLLLKQYSYESKYLNIDYEMPGKTNTYYKNVINICNLAKSDKKFNNFLTNALKKFNTLLAINYVEEIGYEISQEYKDYLINLTAKTKTLIKKELSKPKDEYTTCLYEEYIKI